MMVVFKKRGYACGLEEGEGREGVGYMSREEGGRK